MPNGYSIPMTPSERLDEVARLLALGFLRLRSRRQTGKANDPNHLRIFGLDFRGEGSVCDTDSLDAQREACAAYIDSQRHEGWLALDDRYDDGGYSGGTLERPALQRLIRDIEAGRVDTVVCYKIDRLSRSLKLVDVFERNSVTFVSVTQSFCTTTSMGRLTLNILLSFAQFERELAGERIRDKFAASRRKGIFMGGHPPLGYDVRDRKLVVNPAEAELVRLIFLRFLDLGSALLLIRELNAGGYRTKSWTTQAGTFREGRPFDKGTLYKILRNRTYLGEAVHKGKSYAGEHEPIVDRATWDRVHEVLTANARRRGNEVRARTPAPLRGLMRCTHCGAAMTPTHTRRRGRLYRYYVCLGASRRGHDTCRCARSLPARWRDLSSGRCVGCWRRPSWSRGLWPRSGGRTVRLKTRFSRKAISSKPSERSSRCGTSCTRPSRRASCG
jgi:DNA invertase Pin-like site-specific DNA recombinase